MDVPTIELKLPETKQIVVLKKYLTMGQLKEIQRGLVGDGIVSQEEAAKTMTLDKAYEFQEGIAKLVVQEIRFPDQTVKNHFESQWLDNLPAPDGNLFLDKINSYAGQQLTDESKKK